MHKNTATATVRKPQEVALIGVSRSIQELRAKIEKVATSQSPVLILGETGCGKEVVARKVHELSRLRKFVPIDCSVLVGPLMESELFGYMKGAFTGADTNRTGLLEEAHLGTAFFDEVGELPLSLQVKLLRVLQEREFRPVGSTVARYVESRIIAATNRNLAEEVHRGRFRQDLYFRLNVITLRIPPLRERREDIPVLASYFLDKHAPGLRLPEEVERSLVHYHWPGNVRELENTIHRMSAVAVGSNVRMTDLPTSVLNHLQPQSSLSVLSNLSGNGGLGNGGHTNGALGNGGSAAGFHANGGQDTVGVPTPIRRQPSESVVPLAEVERRTILNALNATRGDRTMAAQLLGIGRTTLYRKLKSYGVEC